MAQRQVMIRMSDEDYASIKAKAEAMRLSVSRYINLVLFKGDK